MNDSSTSIDSGFRPEHAQPKPEEPRKPRFAIMGEFSAGKSTLSNLLIGNPVLPVKVTATQLPPVWISHGDREPYRVDLAGTEHPVDFGALSEISLEDTMCIRVFHKSDALELCDLIDMPGISDPNMSSDVWERALHLADGVIWCTHATQAWRQSESAVWSSVQPALYEKSLLLLTRIDKIMNDRDRQRVVRRVENEVNGLFAGVLPISLTDAIAAGDDHDLWQRSGAEAFAIAIIEIVDSLAKRIRPTPTTIPEQTIEVTPDQTVAAAPDQAVEAAAGNAVEAELPKNETATGSILTKRTPVQAEREAPPKIIPQRITRRTSMSPRPQRSARPVDPSPT